MEGNLNFHTTHYTYDKFNTQNNYSQHFHLHKSATFFKTSRKTELKVSTLLDALLPRLFLYSYVWKI